MIRSLGVNYHYLSFEDNLADIRSKSCTLCEVIKNQLWWSEPQWLNKL